MNKIKCVLLIMLLVSCNRVKQYDCVCYNGIGSDSVSYETYITKNNKLDADKYCDMISTPTRPCWISE